ncbi:N-acetylglucosaminidase [Haloplasma contractile]|uniref:Mannosyl-glycoprotein endo-beta-N-acetylglucosaminidase n=1 Tax=Haloplasma contractile SSD-17B TaxID=1033810 RepID=F7PU84_9MOLU|nr:glucosaminidase domain-containing protein [Haloplasma contractile]ERJ11730.1 mannosyl-glycoprotein endo-beta-N-acetylglucosaminidase [Haloplasma contractile SSD-17B]
MKKHVLIIVAILVMMVTLVGCNRSPIQSTVTTDTTEELVSTTTEETEEVEAPLWCSEEEETSCKFKVAFANEDQSFTHLVSYKRLSLARSHVDELEEDNGVVLYEGKVAHMKYGLVNLHTKAFSENTTVYVDETQEKTYVNGSYSTDALFLDSGTFSIKLLISGVTGWVSLDEVELIPYNQLKSISHYVVTNEGELMHKLSRDILDTKYRHTLPIDVAPSYLEENKEYYSFDGHYFYDDLMDLFQDAREQTQNRAVNSQQPYYNYYQYLPFRSKTNYTADELNTFLSALLPDNSILIDSADYFLNIQNDFYLNAAMELAFGIHESGLGTSKIARDKNNIFGMNATDSNPYGNAHAFNSLEDGIAYHAHYYLSYKYLNPDHKVYKGSNLGNKHQGMNVKYASDAYWGEKIAGHYYRLDKFLGFKDKHAYLIGLTTEPANILENQDLESRIIYIESNAERNAPIYNPVIILDTLDTTYKVNTVAPLVNGKLDASKVFKYDEKSVGYIDQRLIYIP